MLAAKQKKQQLLQKPLYYMPLSKKILKIKVNITVHIAWAKITVALLKCSL